MNPAAKWAYADSESTKYFAGVEQRFANDWLLKVEEPATGRATPSSCRATLWAGGLSRTRPPAKRSL